MATLPKLKAGLDLYRATSEARMVATVTFLIVSGPILALLLTLPTSNVGPFWSGWYNNLSSLRESHVWGTLLVAGWQRAIAALAISLASAYCAQLIAREAAPLAEPFLTPDRNQARIYYDHDARNKLRKQLQIEAGPLSRKGIWLAPHLNLPFEFESRYMMVLAASGHGKSNLVRAWATQMALRGDRMILHCNKGDVTRSFDLESVILISPAHRDGWAWDIAADISGPAAAADFAADIIPGSEQSFWSDTARLLLTDTISALSREKGADWNARDLLEAVLSDPADLRQRIETLDLSASPLLSSGDEDGVSKTVLSIMATLVSAALTTLRPMAYAWSSMPASKKFSVRNWLSEGYTGPKIVIVQTSPDFEVMSTAVCGGILRLACKALSGASVEIDIARRVSFVLDEFYSFGKIPGFARALSVAREKGLTCIIALQSVAQLRNYGEEEKLLLDLFQIKIYSRLTAGPSADWAQEAIGYRDIRWLAPNNFPADGDKRLFVAQLDKKPVVSAKQFASDLGVFRDENGDEFVRAIIHYAGDAYRFDWPLTTWRVVGKGYVPAPWTSFFSAP